MQNYLWLILFFPLLGFLVNGLFGRRLGEKGVGLLGAGAVFASFLTAIFVFLDLIALPPESRLLTQSLYRWMGTGAFAIDIGFRIDPLSMTMALVVTGVGFLIHVYSIGYMHGDRGFGRYFAFLNLFTFAMLLLVMADNFLVMFIGWEGVGLCSYLLIGFYYDQVFDKTTGMTCAQAGSKAFIVNRIGDFGFLLAMFLLFATFGSLQYEQVFTLAGKGVNAGGGALLPGVMTAICLLLFLGATGKSAQIPLYVWLPDAMAGPTPVSALIHAATMVTAGVYMVARCSVLFVQSPVALEVVAVIGVATAAFAGTMALTATDIKKVLAYSTVSQLGYMFLACGVGAFAAGIFHLVTHAFFKALLFLGAGSVMHALSGETNIMKMGGLKKHLPVTHATFLIAGLAIAGIPGFSGFFSKDEILWETFSSPHGSVVFYLIALATAGLTAFYMFRLIYLAFYGSERVDPEVMNHVHESPRLMTVPLMVLAGLASAGGYLGIPHLFNQIGHFLEPVFTRYRPVPAHAAGALSLELLLMAVSVAVALTGILLARRMYLQQPALADHMAARFHRLHTLLRRKYYVDEIYDALFVRPVHRLAEGFLWKLFDVRGIDGFVNFLPRVFAAAAAGLRRWQTGIVQNYAVSIIIGLIVVLGYLLIK
ncbi:MAG: NADH-quinone oxidoreductase subunit L [candidate division KSB1 bacterium]|nr:NADH-quinone oxidoreductase subunit L [candidate division KSB1 bacterium]MDZ7276426.1 NADH-quinone oxidoreductase subunit L [candidate division KSB1 bacterium]MDZ7288096.1 NADH-quinone oxidoreductase subunit L [candidate division KSB1 bacterium]MDZ7300197.1 NADH-quinone oxidoreductase subunit L [candidate division KSB1 bacterium]MDZ7305768.1 NADH-quinone oxidoreductase subunit L [candidate division KSB1 bacterium]